MSEPDAATAVFAALADANRRRVLELVSADPGATASTLAGRLPISRQAVAKHLEVLVDAGLVAAVRSGREVRHHVRVDPLRDTAAWLLARADAWDDRLQALKSAAEEAAVAGETDSA